MRALRVLQGLGIGEDLRILGFGVLSQAGCKVQDVTGFADLRKGFARAHSGVNF